jgi:hypothetical protein
MSTIEGADTAEAVSGAREYALRLVLSSGIARRDATTCSRSTAMVRLFRRWRMKGLLHNG